MALLSSMSVRQKLMLAGCALAVLIIGFLLLRIATAPSYALIATGLDPSKTGKMTAALDEKGIAYELRNNGTGLAVEKTQTAQAQIALSEQGLSGSGDTQPWAGFDKQKLGSSSFQQKVAYQRALEAQIAQTIGQVDGVSDASVQLTLPEDQLFAEESKPASAAVLLTGDATALAPGAVRGIANLVASSVQGLKTDSVTITDGSGQMLWPAGEGGAAADGTMSKQAAETRYDGELEASLNALLVRTVGPGKAQVRVNSVLNVDEVSRETLDYGAKGVPLTSTTDTEKLNSNGGAGGTAAGAKTNIPSYAASGSSGGGKSKYSSKKDTTEFGVDKVITHEKVAPGSVERQDVALMIDKSVPAAEVAALRTAVAGAAGIDKSRGDTLAVSQVAFAKQPADATSGLAAGGGMLDYAKYGLLGLGSLLFLFFVTRHLRRREDDALADPSWLRQLDMPTPIAELEEGPPPSLIPAINPRKMQIEEVVQREPERVATALRGWMNEES